ncbi:MAG: hypothetical protein Q9227_002876 [Pyrenula ochraceoflavens]
MDRSEKTGVADLTLQFFETIAQFETSGSKVTFYCNEDHLVDRDTDDEYGYAWYDKTWEGKTKDGKVDLVYIDHGRLDENALDLDAPSAGPVLAFISDFAYGFFDCVALCIANDNEEPPVENADSYSQLGLALALQIKNPRDSITWWVFGIVNVKTLEPPDNLFQNGADKIYEERIIKARDWIFKAVFENDQNNFPWKNPSLLGDAPDGEACAA